MSEFKTQTDSDQDHRAGILRGIKLAGFGIFFLLLIQTLVWASDFLIPVTGAVLGYFVLNRPRRWLSRIGIPPVVSAAMFTLFLISAVGFAIVTLSQPVSDFIADLPAIVKQIDEKLSTKGGAFQAVNDAADAAGEILNPREGETVEVEVVSKTGFATVIAGLAPSLLGQIAFAILLLFFLISSGDMFIRKTLQSLGGFKDKRRAVSVVHDIEDRLGRYLGGITAINAGLGLSVAAAMALWGLPNVLMIGVMAFAFNFIPFVGAILGTAIVAVLAFVSLEGLWSALGVGLTYMALTSVEAQLVTPALISRHMKLNTTVVFLSIAFFAWIWSVMGMIVALPVLTVIKIACDEIDGLKTIGLFLGQDEAVEDKNPDS
ncbi:AI-2E family transporter [Leisingera sp. HS039]|uniref:AI-2E family transporter n=1 Tax=unclassified Leisingera TaxID=2614906 RepID=UPI001070DE4B|nr:MULTISPECIES: AI-2E family transporter [unclassified Leisingera]MBQ4827525.1 AI-2E family transporter [Leisingera sp. HS039]QBR35319.1 AI-2E family transporter [Leisingera sp. NJS201]